MKIAIFGEHQNGVALAKYGIGELDQVVYFEESPSAALHAQGLETQHHPRTSEELVQLMTDHSIDAYVSLQTTTRYGKEFDLDAVLVGLGLTKLLGASTTLKEVEYDRYAQRLVATAQGLDVLLSEAEGTKSQIRDVITYPAFIKHKGSESIRPILVASSTASGWNKIDDASELWAEPAMASATLLNVNYILCNGSARVLNVIGMTFEDTSRFYGKLPTVMPVDDAFITDTVQPYLDAQATLHNTEKALMSLQFLVDGSSKYYLENNAHPAIVVPWKGLLPLTEITLDQSSFDAANLTPDTFTLDVKRAIDTTLPFENMNLAIDNADIDVYSILMKRDFTTTPGTDIYHMAPTSESATSGIVFYLYNGATVDPLISNLQDKV